MNWQMHFSFTVGMLLAYFRPGIWVFIVVGIAHGVIASYLKNREAY